MRRNHIVFVNCILLNLAAIHFSESQNSLKMVQIITRHGDRAEMVESTPYNVDSTFSIAHLTKKGFQEEITLGQFLRERYNGFLSKTYSLYDFKIYSSDIDRAIQSAVGLTNGLFEMDEEGWPPVPVHTISEKLDNWISITAACPKCTELLEQCGVDVFKRTLEQDEDIFIEYSRNGTITKRNAIYEIENTGYSGLVNAPNGMNIQYMHRIGCFIHSPEVEIRRLLGGPMLQKLFSNFEEMNSTISNQAGRKLRIISGHDGGLVFLMRMWGIFNHKTPPFASALIIEIHEKSSNLEPEVEIYFKNSSNDAFKLDLPECSSPCSLLKLKNISQKYIPINWYEACGLYAGTKNYAGIVLATAVGLAVVAVITLLTCILIRKSYVRIKYQPLLDTSSK